MARVGGFWKRIGDTIEPVFAGGVNILVRGTNRYLNFGSEDGVDGYGFRDNGGTIEYKSSGGSWAAVGSGGGGGGISDGDKEDITVSGSGTVWTIDNGVVTYAKMQNESAHSVVGRAGSGNGVLAGITAGASTILGRNGSGNVAFQSVSTIRTMLGLGAVATSNDYNDLSNKPDLSVYDNFEEYANLGAFPATGATSVIYLAQDTGLIYRWTGSTYAIMSAELALGETSATAYRGDRGKTAYDHSQLTSGNPHSVTKADVGLGSVPNTDFTSAVNANTAKISFDTTSSTRLANTSGTNTGDNATNTQYSGLEASKLDKVLDGTPDTDHSANGLQTNTFNAGVTVAAGEVVYMATDGEWALADASVTATAEKLIGIALEAGTDTNPLLVALPGSFVRDDTWAWTAGDTLYLSLTAGALSATVTATATDEVSRIIGYAVSPDVIYLQPQQGVVHV